MSGAKRKRCLFCRREVATDADWEANGNLPSGEAEDKEAIRLGLDKLCWEAEDDACTHAALESGRPASPADALAALDAATSQVEQLLKAIEEHIEWCRRYRVKADGLRVVAQRVRAERGGER